MSTEQKFEDGAEASQQDRLKTINQQLAETEQALRRTLEFFDRIERSAVSARLGAADIRLRLLTDLERLARDRDPHPRKSDASPAAG